MNAKGYPWSGGAIVTRPPTDPLHAPYRGSAPAPFAKQGRDGEGLPCVHPLHPLSKLPQWGPVHPLYPFRRTPPASPCYVNPDSSHNCPCRGSTFPHARGKYVAGTIRQTLVAGCMAAIATGPRMARDRHRVRLHQRGSMRRPPTHRKPGPIVQSCKLNLPCLAKRRCRRRKIVQSCKNGLLMSTYAPLYGLIAGRWGAVCLPWYDCCNNKPCNKSCYSCSGR